MQASSQFKLVIATGLALFAMFFGAGNMIFPLKLGVISGQHVMPALIAFIISGVGVPFLGLFAVSLYEGDYWKFFQRFGKPFAFLMVTFLILIIGPLFAAPRTEVVTFNTLLPALPGLLKNPYLFDFAYFFLIFLITYKQTHVVDVIGWLLSPIKIIAFTILICAGIYTAAPLVEIQASASQTFNTALTTGYGTMDLLASIFFCTVAYKHLVNKCKQIGVTSQKYIIKMTLFSCIIGAFLIGLIYIGLMLVAGSHAAELHNVPTEALIQKVSYIVLGQYGALFVGICVTFACLATAIALVEVTTDYVHHTILKQKVSRTICLVSILAVMYMMAILGFDGIMKIAGPILNIVYPVLILLCVLNIYVKLAPEKYRFFFAAKATESA